MSAILHAEAGRYDRLHGDEDFGRELTPEELAEARDELADQVLRGEPVRSVVSGLTHNLSDVLNEQGDNETLAPLLVALLKANTDDDRQEAKANIRDQLETWARAYFNESDEAEVLAREEA